jgi:hypothetical protein
LFNAVFNGEESGRDFNVSGMGKVRKLQGERPVSEVPGGVGGEHGGVVEKPDIYRVIAMCHTYIHTYIHT